MYNIYSRSSKAQYLIDSLRSLKKKSVPLTVQSMEGVVVQKKTIILFYMKRFWVRTLGKVNILNSFKVFSN